MREGLGAACEAARPRLCRLLRRILRPQPACGPRRARYSRRAGSAQGGWRAAPRRDLSRTRARGPDPLRASGFRPSVRVGMLAPVKIPMRIYLNQVFSSFRTLWRLQFSSHKRPREAPRASRRGVYAGRSRNWGCFSTGTVACFRTDRMKRAKRFLFYELDPFHRVAHPPPRVCSGGRQEWKLQGKSGPPLPQTTHRRQRRP